MRINDIKQICFPAINGKPMTKHIKWDQIISERLDIYNTVTIRIGLDNFITIEAFQTEETEKAHSKEQAQSEE